MDWWWLDVGVETSSQENVYNELVMCDWKFNKNMYLWFDTPTVIFYIKNISLSKYTVPQLIKFAFFPNSDFYHTVLETLSLQTHSLIMSVR